MAPPERSIVVTAETLQNIGRYNVPDNFIVTMYEVESDGNLQFSLRGSMQVATGRNAQRNGNRLLLNRFSGTQYAGQIRTIYADLSTTGVVLYGCYMRNDNRDKVNRDANWET